MTNISGFKVDLSQDLPLNYLKPYEAKALLYLHFKGEGESREVWNYALKTEQISRATIINFLNSMAEAGILSFREIPGKGGYRRVYKLEVPSDELDWLILKRVLQQFTIDPEGRVDEKMLERVAHWVAGASMKSDADLDSPEN